MFRVPRGPIAGITPFNFPLNLVAHKVAPAMEEGNTILVRPSAQTSLTALLLGKIITEAGWQTADINPGYGGHLDIRPEITQVM